MADGRLTTTTHTALTATGGNYTIKVSPYGIPHRCLYSENIENLYFAGRNISMTHMAMSSARVMGTCTTLGQAVGASVSIAVKEGLTPRQVGLNRINEVQQILLQNDCFLPNIPRKVREENLQVAKDKYAVLVNGKDRNLYREENGLFVASDEEIIYDFQKPVYVNKIKIVFNSDLERISFGDMDSCEKHRTMRCNILNDSPRMFVPKTLAKDFSLEIKYADGRIEEKKFESNLKRNLMITVNEKIKAMKLVVYSNWGGTEKTQVFTFEII
ncbi:MAG: FAD-dependent oxidoreductase [Bacilli bacterium]